MIYRQALSSKQQIGGAMSLLHAIWWFAVKGALGGATSGGSIFVFTTFLIFLATAAVTSKEAGMPTRMTKTIFNRADPAECNCLPDNCLLKDFCSTSIQLLLLLQNPRLSSISCSLNTVENTDRSLSCMHVLLIKTGSGQPLRSEMSKLSTNLWTDEIYICN